MKIAVTYENGEEVSREVINNSTYQTSDVTVKVGTKSDNAEATKLVEEQLQPRIRRRLMRRSARHLHLSNKKQAAVGKNGRTERG